MTTNTQSTEITYNINVEGLGAAATGPRDTNFPASNKLPKSTGLGADKQNVDVVACVRGNESAKSTSISHKKHPSGQTSVDLHARASNIVYKIPGCDSCPACGHWDGFGRMGPGRYCFFTAVFKGKASRPVPIAEAQKACPKKDDPNLCGN